MTGGERERNTRSTRGTRKRKNSCASCASCVPFPFAARHWQLLFPECSEIDIAMMPSQEIHEPLVIRIGDSEQRQHLPIAAARPFETASNHMLHLRSSDHPLRIRAR